MGAGNVCELDIIFNFHKAYYLLDELVMGGELQETNKKEVRLRCPLVPSCLAPQHITPHAIVLAPMLLPRTMVERVLNVANIQSWIYDRLAAGCPKEPCPVDRKFRVHPTLRASSVSPTPVTTMVMMTTTLGCN